MDPKAITDGIYAKFVADSDLKTALGGDSARRMYDTKAVQDPGYPYCVFRIINGIPDNTFSENGEILNIQFSIFHYDEDSPLDRTTINDAIKKLCAAYDDTTLTITSHTSVAMTRGIANILDTEDNTQQAVITYELMIQDD